MSSISVKYKKYLFIVLIGINSHVFSQEKIDDPVKMPTIIPAYPEAQGLRKYGEIPVSTYTGVPDISIPLYTLKAGSLKLPISLSYHASGIAVNQEATWVGLGWNLIAGGSISYIPVGGVDYHYSIVPNYDKKLTPDQFAKVRDYVGRRRSVNSYAGWSCVPVDDTIFTTEIINSIINGRNQQDVYSANFLNYSFKFVEDPIEGTMIIVGQNNKCIIKKTETGFEIKGEDGTSYYFEDFESVMVGGIQQMTSSWYLSKIKSVDGDSIVFRYKECAAMNLPSLSEMLVIDSRDVFSTRVASDAVPSWTTHPHRDVSLPSPINKNLYLKEIETKNELIIFESDSDRIDYLNGYKLNRVIIRDKYSNTDKFSYRLAYSYFEGCSTGGDYLKDGLVVVNTPFTEDNKTKRLKLDSLVQENGNQDNMSYVFKYNDQVALPSKTSFSQDFWGYFNGEDNRSIVITGANHTLIPNVFPLMIDDSITLSVIPGKALTFKGAVRGTNEEFTTAGMLTSIEYPTKGRTVFEFEPNEFNNYTILSAKEEASTSFIINKQYSVVAYSCAEYREPPFSTYEVPFSVKNKTVATFNGFLNDDFASVSIIGVNNDFDPIKYKYTGGSEGGLHKESWSDELFWLEPGEYKLICSVDINSYNHCSGYGPPDVQGTISFMEFVENDFSGHTSIGGGVRIKSIINYDENNKIVSSKRYKYIDENGNTSGLLMVPIQYVYDDNKTVGWTRYNPPAGYIPESYDYGTYVNFRTIIPSNNYVSFSAHSCGHKVGYDRVEIESYDGDISNGREILYFINQAGYLTYGRQNDLLSFQPGNNGNLIKKHILQSNGDTLLTEINYYDMLESPKEKFINLCAKDEYIGPSGFCIGQMGRNPLAYYPRFAIYTHPTYCFYQNLSKKEIIHYLSGEKLKETTNYTYNVKNYGIESVTKFSSGTNFNVVAEYKYPVDYSNPPYTWMVEKNTLTPVIEQTDWVNNTFVQSTKTNYKDWFNDKSIIAPETVEIERNPSSPEIRVHYKYNAQGKLLESSKDSDVKTCYIWGYNGCFPVVKIEGIEESEIPQTLKEEISKHKFLGRTDFSSVKADREWLSGMLESLRNSNACLVSFYTYNTIFGITSQTDPNGITTYYEYDSFGRLELIRDNDRNIISTYEYNYKD